MVKQTTRIDTLDAMCAQWINYDCILSYRRHSILLTPWCDISLGSRVEEHLMGALRRTEDQPGNHGHSRHGIEPFGSVAEREQGIHLEAINMKRSSLKFLVSFEI